MALLAFDQGIKAYIVDHIIPMQWSISIYPYGGIPVFQDWHGIDFSLNYAMNKGAAWGAFSSFSSALLYMRFLIIGALLSYLLFSKATFWKKLFLSLITTGAIGNVVDFFVYGHVVDMFHFCFWGYSFPVFNVADSAIFCGVAALLFQNVKGEKVAHDRSY
jgi:signal peptidase II